MKVSNASHIKFRKRASRAEMEGRRTALLEIVGEMHPMTVRQVFYQASIRDIVEKSESGYAKVQRALVELRRAGQLPYRWIADNTRWQRKPRTFRDPAEAVRNIATFYRKDLWYNALQYVEIWLEKDALAGVVFEETKAFDVPLMVSRGYASLSFLHNAGTAIRRDGRPTFIYHLGDYDPSGQDAADKIEAALREYAPGVKIEFRRLAVLPEQISDWSLPTRPTKTSDTRSKNFGAISVELDAIDPHQLRRLVRDAIEHHLPQDQLAILKAAETSEQQLLKNWASSLEPGE